MTASFQAGQYIRNKLSICSNCGIQGHHYKYCTEPITSYGILAFRFADKKFHQPQTLAAGASKYLPPQLEYLLVQRRDSIGFIELLRAKYKLSDVAYIQEQIDGTTPLEREALLTKSFDELWSSLWGGASVSENKQYRQEYEVAKQKFESFSQGYVYNGQHVTLQSMIEKSPLQYGTPEWGFPKGRRNVSETNFKCALREFTEETGLQASDICILDNIEPITEIFYGNNHIHYKHIYYIAYIPNHIHVKMQPTNEHMMREIGNIGWFSFEAALQTIRHTNPEKRQVLERVNALLQFVCPLFIGPMLMCDKSETEELTVNRDNESAATRITNPWGKPGSGSWAFADNSRSGGTSIWEPITNTRCIAANGSNGGSANGPADRSNGGSTGTSWFDNKEE